jgi:hypothetical protein
MIIYSSPLSRSMAKALSVLARISEMILAGIYSYQHLILLAV